VIDATGPDVTVTDAVPIRLSLVAEIVDVPAAIPVTTPVGDTLATPLVPDDQLTTWPLRVFPAESLATAAKDFVCPTLTLPLVGNTVTEATGTGVTVTTTCAVFPSQVATIVADPGPTPVTTPASETVATLILLVDHKNVRPGNTTADVLSAVALTGSVSPIRIVVRGIATVTETTGSGPLTVSPPAQLNIEIPTTKTVAR
jgi:hypothetical protein